MKKIVIVLTAAMIGASILIADNNNIVTEQSVTDAAVKNNPGLLSTYETARSYEAKSHKQFFLENPMAGVDYMYGNLSPGYAGQKYYVISQNIPFPLKYIWKANSAASEADYYKKLYEVKQAEVLNQARSAYYALYKTTKYIEITSEAVNVLKQLSDIAFARYNQGVVSQQDVAKLDIETDLLENELLTLGQQKETDIQRIRAVTADSGLLSGTAYTMEEPGTPELKAGFDDIKNMVLKGAPTIKAAASGKDAAVSLRNTAIADYLPNFSLMYKNSFDPAGQGYELMVQAEIPIFFFNNQQADIGEKWEEAESKESGLEQAQNDAVFEAMDHYDTIKADYRLMDLYKSKLIPQADAALKSAMASYKSRKIEFMTLLDSERTLLDMKKDYYMRLTEYLMHFRMLEQLVGKSLEEAKQQ